MHSYTILLYNNNYLTFNNAIYRNRSQHIATMGSMCSVKSKKHNSQVSNENTMLVKPDFHIIYLYVYRLY